LSGLSDVAASDVVVAEDVLAGSDHTGDARSDAVDELSVSGIGLVRADHDGLGGQNGLDGVETGSTHRFAGFCERKPKTASESALFR
jgi:hypothetical protein